MKFRSARTREVKLGAIFTQTQTDADGLPVRDHAATTYVGGFESAPDFGLRVRAEARRRGLGQAAKVVFLGDGAAWIWELARVNFPLAILILDLYHALERLHELCAGLYGADRPTATRMKTTWTAWLKADRVADVIAAARHRLVQLGPPPDDTREKQIADCEHHQDKMLYQTYRAQGLFYGSGVIEGGCRSVVGQRLKESGMFWTETGATSVLTLRVALKSLHWDPNRRVSRLELRDGERGGNGKGNGTQNRAGQCVGTTANPRSGTVGEGLGVFFPGTTKPVGDPRMSRTVDDLKLAKAVALPHGSGLRGQIEDFPNPQHACDGLFRRAEA